MKGIVLSLVVAMVIMTTCIAGCTTVSDGMYIEHLNSYSFTENLCETGYLPQDLEYVEEVYDVTRIEVVTKDSKQYLVADIPKHELNEWYESSGLYAYSDSNVRVNFETVVLKDVNANKDLCYVYEFITAEGVESNVGKVFVLTEETFGEIFSNVEQH